MESVSFLAGVMSPTNLTTSFKSGLSASGGGLSTGSYGTNSHGPSKPSSAFILTATETPSPVKSSLKLPLSSRVSKKRNSYGGSRAITFCSGSFNHR